MVGYAIQKPGVQGISQQTQNNDLSFFEFSKIFLSYVVVAQIFSGLGEDALRFPPETVAWCASKTFVAMKYATMCAFAIHMVWHKYSAPSSSRQAPKFISPEKRIEVLQSEIARLRQKLATHHVVAHKQ
jgi:hypothetical protein